MKHKAFSSRIWVKPLLFAALPLLLLTAMRPAYQESTGETLYDEHCKSCHRGGGSGFFRMFPPLDDLNWVGSDSTVVRVIIKGLKGPITVDGKNYERQMQPMAYLPDAEIAAIVNYIRSDFNNYTDSIKPATVEHWRKQFTNTND